MAQIPWSRGEVRVLANGACTACGGCGEVSRYLNKRICHCVHRSVFRACYNRFRECDLLADSVQMIVLEGCARGKRAKTYSRPRQEFCADFCSVGSRALESHLDR